MSPLTRSQSRFPLPDLFKSVVRRPCVPLCVSSDVEATVIDDKSIAHSEALIAEKFVDGRIIQEKKILMIYTDTLSNPLIQNKNDVKRKMADSVFEASKMNCTVKFLKFKDGQKFKITYILNHGGGRYIAHNMISDLQTLADTQEFVGGERIVKRNIAKYPDTGMYDKNWCKIKLLDSMSIIQNRCPNFMINYKKYVIENNIKLTKTGLIPIDLANLSKFVNGESKQNHTALGDTTLLTRLINLAIKMDGKKILNGKTYIVQPERIRITQSSQSHEHEHDNKTITFGKHRGLRFIDVYNNNDDYCTWVMKQNEPSPDMHDLQTYLRTRTFVVSQ
jgi:hypothetical protein